MLIPGHVIKEICDAFQVAFDRDDLRIMLREDKQLNVNLDDLTGPNTKWRTAVFDVVTWSERRGLTAELIRAAHEFNPTHPALESIYQKFALTPIDLQKCGTP